jgi:enoyl reductase-like protein
MAALTSDEPIPVDMIWNKLSRSSSVWQDERVVETVIRIVGVEEAISVRLRTSADIMRSRKIFLACMEAGWSTSNIQNSIRTAFENDEEIVLASLRHSAHVGMCHNMGAMLRSDRDFMERAIRVDARVLAFASSELRYDYDLMLMSIGSNRNALQPFSHRSNGDDMWKLVEFAERVRDRLAIAETYIMEFLRGIAIPLASESPPPPRKRARKTKTAMKVETTSTAKKVCHLPMLECGFETGMATKRLIGAFADVPVGDEYRLLRDASENLAFFGY